MKYADLVNCHNLVTKAIDAQDVDFLQSDSQDNIKSIILKSLLKTSDKPCDREIFKSMIDLAITLKISSVENSNDFEEAFKGDDINGIIDVISRESKDSVPDFSAFDNKLQEKRFQKISQKLRKLADIRNEMCILAIGSLRVEENEDINVVSYSDYTLQDKTEYSLFKENALINIQNAIFENGSKPDDIRLVDGNFFVDFEDYGYVFPSEKYENLLSSLYDIQVKVNVAKADSYKIMDGMQDSKNISYMLGTFSSFVRGNISSEIADVMCENGEMIADAVGRFSNGDNDAISVLSSIQSHVSEQVESLLSGLITEHMYSPESIRDGLRVYRQSKLNFDFNFEEAMKKSDSNVNEAVNYHNEGNTFMFKTKLKDMSSFEKAAVKLIISEKAKNTENNLDI